MSGIVYCLSRKKVDETAQLLVDHGVRALPYHAGMSAAAREANQNAFMTEPNMVMVATIAFGMGIDKADVRFVFHVDLPSSLEAYYQEIGRAGRDGASAEAHMLFGLSDIRMRRQFIEQEDAGEERKRREHHRLDLLIAFCEAPGCRRQILLGYFGEEKEPCGNCDTCVSPAALADGTALAKTILATIERTGQRFGTMHIIDILRGAQTQKILASGHNSLPTFGVGADRNKPEWQSLIRQLIASGFIALDVTGYGSLTIGEPGRLLLKGEKAFPYRADHVQRPSKRALREAAKSAEIADGKDAALLAALKKLRLALAKEREVPAFVIFSDRTLIDMVQRRPRDGTEFAEVNGVGAAKLKDFGEVFLGAIRAHQAAG
jgi:ATP-dependent DNA helicase RecQ